MGTGGNNTPMAMVTIAVEGNGARPSHRGDGYIESNQSYTLNSTEVHGVASMEDNNYRVRRLTPTECERLQGFPDGWTDIGEWTDSKGKVRQTTDSARYKALGNSIGLPPWKWVLKRISAQYERDATMASLFDGIGGFPVIWEQLNGRGSCLWASEIEEFCIAVTEKRINGKDTVDLRNP
jgi:DNA (cytosine-5)-methyltransferase 1